MGSPYATIQFVGNMDVTAVSKSTTGKDVIDFAVIARLVEILKTPSPNLQREASSILEFLTIIEPHLDTILSVYIESGLEAVFQQKILDVSPNNKRCTVHKIAT